MFTEQISTLGAILRQQGLDDASAAAFEQLLGSCSATLSQRGTVNLPAAQFVQVPPSGQRADYAFCNLTGPTTIEQELTVEGDTIFEGGVIFNQDITIGDGDPLVPATLCLLGCGTWDSEGCYNVPEYKITFPAGATAVTKRTVRLQGCTDPPPPSSLPPSIPPSDIPSLPPSSVPAWDGMTPEDDTERSCEAFVDGTAPAFVLIDITGIAIQDVGLPTEGCNQCLELNYYSYVAQWSQLSSGVCSYSTVWFWFCEELVSFRVVAGMDHGDVLMAVYLTTNDRTAVGYMLWAGNLGPGPIDGSTLDVYIPFVSDNPWSVPQCDGENSVLRVRVST